MVVSTHRRLEWSTIFFWGLRGRSLKFSSEAQDEPHRVVARQGPQGWAKQELGSRDFGLRRSLCSLSLGIAAMWQKDRVCGRRTEPVASVSVFVTDKTLDMNNLSEESGFCSILFFLDRVFRSLKLVLVSVL